MVLAARVSGLFFSILCHIFILLIPLSLATNVPKTYPPVELVMTMAPPVPEPAPPPAAPPQPEPPRPKVKPQPRPQPRPVITEPVPAKTFMPQPVAPPRPLAPVASAPRPVTAGGSPGPPGPVMADFGSAQGPAFLRRVLPVYPELAKRLGKEGRVVLRLHIDARGNLQRVEVVEGAGFGFEEAAVVAVKQSSFRPAMVQGEPRACIARLPIKFVLKN